MQDDAEVNSLSAGAQYDNVTASICGLEISIRNISAQEIDVIFPGNQYCNINNPGRTQIFRSCTGNYCNSFYEKTKLSW